MESRPDTSVRDRYVEEKPVQDIKAETIEAEPIQDIKPPSGSKTQMTGMNGVDWDYEAHSTAEKYRNM